MKLFDRTFITLEKGLDAYSTRSKALANNIANVNTPNYKRQDIQFEEMLEEALKEDSIKVEGAKTHKGHMGINSIPEIENIQANVISEEETFMRNDNNNVDIEKEMAENAKNNIRYQLATTRISGGFNLLKNVIKGR